MLWVTVRRYMVAAAKALARVSQDRCVRTLLSCCEFIKLARIDDKKVQGRNLLLLILETYSTGILW